MAMLLGRSSMHIAFIAMSGVRVVDPELLRLGLTLPGFVERGKVIASLPSLGLLTLAALTPTWHQVSYHEVSEFNALQAIDINADLVAISSFSAQIIEAYALADYLRTKGMRVVIGGPHVSILPHEAQAHVDVVIIGEGELVWPQVIADAERQALQPFYGERGVPFDLSLAPIPRYDLLERTRYNRITVQTARGCPHRCEFCAATPVMTRGYRQKPADKILAEMDAIAELWPRPFIEFADDNTFVDKMFWKQLLPEIKKRQVRWFTETDISIAQDADLLAQLADAGCAQLLIGLESPVTADLIGIDTHDWKRRRSDSYRDALARIHAHGISVNGCFIVGLDNHDVSIFPALDAFIRETKLTEVQLTVQTAFPGTPLYERLQRENRLIEPTNWRLCTLFEVNFIPQRMSVTELRQGFHQLMSQTYSTERTNERKKWLREMLRNKRG
jgi:radical SAM superfamily enzyme YgiQ (UPF0313 family)